ncbi:response regulator [Filimonas effusa]|uniref:Response regulator transcription factor n=1 Tax=Filimonas effusa TaxID=2508721 RepID=A0A4Q1DDA4_9BACT|nr:response regulator transcription factor [Filimonas effusa]RXK86539.1 response regulator transcription factor [Filimonas effusa]
MRKTIEVVITDDHPIVVNGLKKVLDDFEHIQVTAVFHNGNDLLQSIAAHQPNVLVLDMHLPDTTGIEIARIVTKKYPAVKILVLSSSDIILQVKKMLQIGCAGYLLKDSDDLTIVAAIETVFNGGQYLSPSLHQRVVDDMFKTRNIEKKQALLTKREKEVLQLIIDELTSQEIAAKLFISPHTVENHRISLMQKLEVKNTAGLVKKALEGGLTN